MFVQSDVIGQIKVERLIRMGKMFPFITGILNPLCGECAYNCKYCWAKVVKELYNMKKYNGPVHVDEKLLKHPTVKGRAIIDDDYLFFVDMLDMFGSNIPTEMILRILEIPKRFPKTKFLILTKNPSRYLTLISEYGPEVFPPNCTLGVTIESNRSYPTISKAPDQQQRIDAMKKLRMQTDNPLFVCLEPILDFDWGFIDALQDIRPSGIAVGYDNYNNRLPEPPLRKTEELLWLLEKFQIPIYRKTIRRAWYET